VENFAFPAEKKVAKPGSLIAALLQVCETASWWLPR
jgi:hypothetical protein